MLRLLSTLSLVCTAVLSAQDPKPPRFVRVACSDMSGKPVANAQVHVFQRTDKGGKTLYREFGPYRTNAEGIARCRALTTQDGEERAAFDRWIYARVPGSLVGVARSVRNERTKVNATGAIPVTLCPSRALPGTVAVPSGYDPKRVRVRVISISILDGKNVYNGVDFGSSFPRRPSWRGLGGSLPEVFDCSPDARGEFVLRDVPKKARVYLAAEAPQLGQAQWANVGMGFVPIPEKISLELQDEASITGTVEDPDGKPLGNTRVTAQIASSNARTFVLWTFDTRTRKDGTFTIGSLPEGAFDLRVDPLPNERWAFRPMRLSIGSGEKLDAEIALERGQRVHGIVVDASTGQPLEGAAVMAITGDERRTQIGGCPTEKDGKFELWLPRGSTRLYFGGVPAGYSYPKPQIVRELDVTDKAVDALRFELTKSKPAKSK